MSLKKSVVDWWCSSKEVATATFGVRPVICISVE